MLEGFSVVDENVVYSTYVTAVEIHTFMIGPNETEPTLLYESNVALENIYELTLTQ